MPQTLLYATPLLLLLLSVAVFIFYKRKPKVLLQATRQNDHCVRVKVNEMSKHDLTQVVASIISTILTQIPQDLREATLEELLVDVKELQGAITTIDATQKRS